MSSTPHPTGSPAELGFGHHLSAIVVITEQEIEHETWLRNERTATAAVGTVTGRPAELEVTGPGAFAVVCEWDGAEWDTREAALLALNVLEGIKADARGTLLLTVSIEATRLEGSGDGRSSHGRRSAGVRMAASELLRRPLDGEVLLSERWTG